MVVGHQADAVRGRGARRRAARVRDRPPGGAARDRPRRRAARRRRSTASTGDVLILYGDVPLIRTATLRRSSTRIATSSADLTLLTDAALKTRTGYGRILREPEGGCVGIVEERDATDAERAITEVNPGFYCVRAEVLFPLLAELRPDNAQGELYLTDVVGMAARRGTPGARRVAGRATRRGGRHQHASGAGAAWRRRLRAELVERWMAAGVTFEDPGHRLHRARRDDRRRHRHRPERHAARRARASARAAGSTAPRTCVDATLGDGVHLRFGCVARGRRGRRRRASSARSRACGRARALAERVHIGNFVETKKARARRAAPRRTT